MTTPPRSLEPTAAAQQLSFSDPSLACDGRIWFAIFPRYLLPDPLLQGVNEH